MGDRGNVIIKDGESKVFLYTHWRGSDLPAILRGSLKRADAADRLNDGPYLARIIFCDMVGKDANGTSGFGISSTYGDGGTDIEVDVDAQSVSFNGVSHPIADWMAATTEGAA